MCVFNCNCGRGVGVPSRLSHSDLDSSLGIVRAEELVRPFPPKRTRLHLLPSVFMIKWLSLTIWCMSGCLAVMQPANVFDRLHINGSASFILKNTEKAELDTSAPFL